MILSIVALVVQARHRIMSYEAYAKVKHARPYVLDIRQGTGEFVYFGVAHTHDLRDKQIQSIRRQWDRIRPEVVLNEDIPRVALGTLQESVERDGESGAVAFWAKEAGVPNRSLDMTRGQEISELRKRFSEADLKVFYALRSYQELSRRPREARGDRTPEQVMDADLRQATAEGLKNGPNRASELDAYWRTLRMPADWRKAKSSWFDPGLGGAGTRWNEIAKASSEVRDQFMLDRITEWVGRGKRVLAVMGASHVVMQEQAIREALPRATVRRVLAP